MSTSNFLNVGKIEVLNKLDVDSQGRLLFNGQIVGTGSGGGSADVDLSDYITAAEIEEIYQTKAALETILADYALKSELPEAVDLTDYVTSTDLETELEDYALKTDIPEEVDLTDYVTSTDLETELADYALKSELPEAVDLTDYALKSELPDLTDYALKSELPEAVDLTDYVTSTELSTELEDYANMVNVTYSELVSLISNQNLAKGCYYRITDFVSMFDTSYQPNSTPKMFENGITIASANHAFDIIVFALTESELDVNARAIKHASETYFNGKEILWKLKYTVDNTQCPWCASNGKGCIYYMKDDKNNEAGFDFKNLIVSPTNGEISNLYAFSFFDEEALHNQEEFYIKDYSVVSDLCHDNSYPYDEIINEDDEDYEPLCLNIALVHNNETQMNNIKVGSHSYFNTFLNDNAYITIGNYTKANQFEGCYYVNVGSFCSNLDIGDETGVINIGNSCEDISISGKCGNINISNSCYEISIEDGSNINIENCDNVFIDEDSQFINIRNCKKISLTRSLNGSPTLSSGDSIQYFDISNIDASNENNAFNILDDVIDNSICGNANTNVTSDNSGNVIMSWFENKSLVYKYRTFNDSTWQSI